MDIKPILNRFTVYQYMTVFLVVLHLVSAFFYGFGIRALLPVLIAVATTTTLDFAITYFKFKAFEFPQSALISGLFIGGLLTQNLQWHVYAIAGAIAILSKHLIKFQQKHIFNPANFGVLISITALPLFGITAFESWWIASPLILVLVFGAFIAWKLKRFDLVLSFLLAYFAISLLLDVSQPARCGMMRMECPMHPSPLAEAFYSVANGGILYFFAMFMLIEPKTNPGKNRVVYGVAVAIALTILLRATTQGLLLALAIGNMAVPLLSKMNVEFKKKGGAEKMPLSESIKRTDY
ncbi:RnfABCDGE type electron transport complex subunit D [Candidatus Woesearchaeota archaeon]|nr:RnfABCDGE type electron transport complex subunit D [Candidatus Woesearchaeota archaeon]